MAGVSRYNTLTELGDFLNNTVPNRSIDQTVDNFLSTDTNGIEALPYQFMESVDRRIKQGSQNTNVGRKYGEKIFSRMPLLFLTPCEPLFMDEFNKKDKNVLLNALFGNTTFDNAFEMLSNEESRRFYSADFNYEEYYRTLNIMLACVATYLGIQDEKIFINGTSTSIIDVDWTNELNNDFKTFFSSAENLIFYMDGFTSMSESFSNTTTESSLAGMINQTSDQIREIQFLFGSGNVASTLAEAVGSASKTIGSGLSSIAQGLAGGIIGSVTENLPSMMSDGGKVIFPKIWGDSSFDRSYQIDFKFRSPDHDSLSIFLNVLKPYCKLLSLVLPRALTDNKDPNFYRSPFLVKANAKGLFSIDMGIISSLSVTKGAECMWNDDGLPTQIDASITIEDLYQAALHTDSYDNNPIKNQYGLTNIVNNTAYQDFLANMAGINIAKMEMGRKTAMYLMLTRNYAATSLSRTGNILSQSISRQIGRLWRTI